MENELIVLPPIQICFHKGKKVISTTQIAALCKCSRQNVTDVFHRHRADFFEGVDYFYLEKDELYNFKVENGIFEEEDAGISQASNPRLLRSISKTAGSAIVWTQTGVLKQATFFNTNRIKKFLRSAVPVIFGNDTTSEIIEETAITSPISNNLETVKLLIKMTELATDKKLRDQLIQTAFNILIA